ncbi:MarR family winged helix-turn-helix transcriptional regulator [Microbulbifer hydrolyticus]|uniref:MarR family transcriptional regulator n=1 Tax=Microbulbifer hydrolyticus TaxID=48074 RepID=A0A6P1TDR5_9GAMM|nr:MarR family transcriptional regulator [Microbulbifer hydrolyticus]MBB5212538.1 DNA-binding MarR family transcriptional regulator [Microbulbifer hydrolyticus]QHQ40157.1 MarR family transcriptional regulator [Microbulbifer hydrolyticus]
MNTSDTAAQLGFELHTAARLLKRNFDRRAKTHGLTRARWQVLWILNKDQGMKQAELAERMDVAPITLTRQIDLLETEGLVERRPDPQDRRCFRIFLTSAAAPVLEILQGLAAETRRQALAGISADEQRQLMNLLSRVRKNLGREEMASE